MASKLRSERADGFFHQRDAENCENLFFLRNRSVPENFQREIFSEGVPMDSLRTHDSEYVYI